MESRGHRLLPFRPQAAYVSNPILKTESSCPAAPRFGSVKELLTGLGKKEGHRYA